MHMTPAEIIFRRKFPTLAGVTFPPSPPISAELPLAKQTKAVLAKDKTLGGDAYDAPIRRHEPPVIPSEPASRAVPVPRRCYRRKRNEFTYVSPNTIKRKKNGMTRDELRAKHLCTRCQQPAHFYNKTAGHSINCEACLNLLAARSRERRAELGLKSGRGRGVCGQKCGKRPHVVGWNQWQARQIPGGGA